MHGITPRFLTSTATFRPNPSMPTAWTVALQWSKSSNRFVTLREEPSHTAGESSSGGASSVKTLPGGTLSETSLPSSAPNPMPAPSPAPSEAAARHTARPAPRSESALTRARAANVPPRRQTRSGTASLAAFFEQRTLHNLRLLALYTNVEMQDVVHHLENAPLFAEYGYVSTASAKLKVPNTFKEVMSLPQVARWKAVTDREITSPKKHDAYELVPASSVPAG